ncbi:MAG: hypothetical protein SVM79_04790 [Chloroflexota bacterium]|nr:hypothetical protein [Chloroflexota bacterium]
MTDEDFIIHINRVSWQGLNRWELALTREEVCLYKRRSILQFWKSPELALSMPTDTISSAELDAQNRLTIHKVNQENAEPFDVLSFEFPEEAESFTQALQNILEELRIEREKAEKEAAEREQKERERRAKEAEVQKVRNDEHLIWHTAEQIWEITSELRQIMLALRNSEDWTIIRTSWQRIENTLKRSNLNLSGSLSPFLPAINNRLAGEVYRNTLTFLGLLGSSLESAETSRDELEVLAEKYNLLPRWSHLSYLLLFAMIYTETIMCSNIGDKRTVSENIYRLHELAIVLKEEFEMNLDNYIGVFDAALERGDPDLVRQTSRDLETYILEVIQSNTGA